MNHTNELMFFHCGVDEVNSSSGM